MKSPLRSISLSQIYDLGPMMDLVSVQIRSVHVFLSIGLTNEIERRGLKSGMVSALSLITANPGIAQNEVARSTGTDRTTMVELMEILQQKGWVTRERTVDDRRRYALFATGEGKKVLAEIISAIRAHELKMLEAFPSTDLEQFLELLWRMRAACLQAAENETLATETHELRRTV